MADGQPDRQAAFAAQLAALKGQFVAQLPQRLAALGEAARAVQGPPSRALLEDLHGELHKLAGSGGTFGLPELSRRARALEVRSRDWLAVAAAVVPSDWQQWCQELDDLRASLAESVTAVVNAVAPSQVAEAKPKEQLRLVLIESAQEAAVELVRGLSQFGYELTHFPTLAQAEAALRAAPPDILLLDVADATALASLRPALGEGEGLLVTFFVEGDDFGVRLAAARAGGDICLSRPLDAPTVAARIETLLRERDQPPYRVLIVDDDETLAEHYRLTLGAAGMLAERVSDPLAVWSALQALRPDLLLMDLHMPQYSGAELAHAIRYDEAWQGLPIVYLSAESDLDQQIHAMRQGADDFLVKPIADVQLVAGVRARAARSRKLAELMSQDSLTGLLKHANIKDRLAQEIDRANRQGKLVSAAMVDIDFFKKVNDTWGHPMGDQVIRTLGQLLRQRLRRQDSVGRYGGEEFAAILPDCSPEDAERLLNDIRLRFAEVSFHCRGQAFSVTLSVGLAGNERHRSATDLLAAADAALYEAKRGGRNQVRLADARLPAAPAHPTNMPGQGD